MIRRGPRLSIIELLSFASTVAIEMEKVLDSKLLEHYVEAFVSRGNNDDVVVAIFREVRLRISGASDLHTTVVKAEKDGKVVAWALVGKTDRDAIMVATFYPEKKTLVSITTGLNDAFLNIGAFVDMCKKMYPGATVYVFVQREKRFMDLNEFSSYIERLKKKAEAREPTLYI